MKTFKILVASFFVFFAFSLAVKAADDGKVPVFDFKYSSISEFDSRLFILNGDNSISIFDTNKNSFIITRKKIAGDSSVGIFVSPSGKYFAVISSYVNKGFANISIYSTEYFIEKENPSPKLVYSVSGWGIFNAVFPPDEKKVILSESYEKTLWFLGTDSFVQNKTILNFQPDNLAISQDGKDLFIASKASNAMSVVNVQTEKVVKTEKLGAIPNNIKYDDLSGRLFVSNASGANNVMAYSFKTGEKKLIPVGTTTPGSLALDKKTGEVFVANDAEGTVSVIGKDLKVNNVIDIKSVAVQRTSPIQLFLCGENGKLVILNNTSRIYLIYDIQAKQIVKEGKLPFVGAVFGMQKNRLAFFAGYNENNFLKVNLDSYEENFVPEKSEAETLRFLDHPMIPIIDENRERLYVGNLGSGRISIVDIKTMEPIGSFFAVDNPYALALNSKAQKLYVSSPTENKFVVADISGNDFKIIKTLDIGNMPQALLFDEKRNKIYICNMGESTITIVDGKSDEVEKTIEIKELKMIYNSMILGNNLVVRDVGGDSIALVNLENYSKKIIKTGRKPIRIEYIPESNLLLVSVDELRQIVILDMKKMKEIKRILINATPYRIYYYGKYVYVSHRQSDRVTIIDPKNGIDAQIIGTEKMKFFGELDIKYNQFVYSKKLDIGFVTDQRASAVFAVKNQPKPETEIMNLVWMATINKDAVISGNPDFLESLKKAKEEKIEKASFFAKYKKWIISGSSILLAVILVIVILIIRRRRSNMEAQPL